MRVLRSVFRNIAYLLIVTIILFATIFLVVKELTPLLNQYRGDLEHYVSATLQVPVTIKQVRVSWRQYQPVIDLEQVTFHNKENQQPVLTVQRVTLFFSIPRSIWSKQLVTNGIWIDGAALSIKQIAEKEYSVDELKLLGLDQLPETEETTFNEVMAWVSHIPKLALRHIELNVTRLHDVKHHVTLQDLYFTNDGAFHRIEGEAVLHQTLPTEVSIVAEWQGEKFDLAKVDSKVNLYLSGLNLSQWLHDQPWQGWVVKEGIASARVWLEWSQGVLKQVQTQLQLYGLNIKSTLTNEERLINRVSGDMGLKWDGQQLVIAGDDVLLNFPAHLWPVTNFYVELNHDEQQQYHLKQLRFSYFDLQDIQSFAQPLLKLLPEPQQKLLNQLHCQGSIQDLSIDFSDNHQDLEHLTLKGELQRVSVKPWEQYPGVKNLSGDIAWNGSHGSLRLNSAKTTFIAPKIFNNDLFLDQLSGMLEFKKNDQDKWQLNLSNFQLLNRDVSLTANGQLTLLPNDLPYADITANFSLQQAAHVSDYLPLSIFEKELTEWLKQAFLSGELQDGQAVLRGPLAAYPFDQGEGEFKVTGRLNHIDLRFSPEWPTIDKIDGQIEFSGRKLQVAIQQAETLGLKTSSVKGVIPSIGGKDPAVLQITTQPFSLDADDGMNYIFKSPLNLSIGTMLKGLKLQGDSRVALSLSIPLEHPEKTEVSGDLSLKNATVTLPYDLTLTDLSGSVHFTENSLTGKQLQSVLFKKPFQFDLTTDNINKNRAVIQASFDRIFEMKDIEQWLKYSFSSYVDGSTKIAGIVSLVQDQPVNVSLRSNLKGLNIHSDSLLDKSAAEEKDFSAELIIADNQPLKIKAQYDKQFDTTLTLTRKKNDFELVAADLSARNLNLNGLSLTNLKLKATPAKESWMLAMNSQEIVGEIKVPKQWSKKSLLEGRLSKVAFMTSSTKTNAVMDLNLQSFPAIALTIDDFNINNMSLGKLIFNATPNRNGLTINALQLTAPYLSLKSSGVWTQSGRQTKTSIQGNATSSSVSKMLTKLGFDAHNFEAGKGESQFSLNWLGAPFELSVARLQGEAAMNINGGRIVDVGKEGGAKMDLARMLSLFSLQTIPRRLLFDFSDIFKKGYSFDTLSGNFTFSEGQLNTRNLQFDGPIAHLKIQGRIGLTNKDYDLVLGVTSHVTSSIPVAAALLTGNPLIGVGAFVANTLIGSSFSKATGYEYTIKGPWNNPSWQAVKAGR